MSTASGGGENLSVNPAQLRYVILALQRQGNRRLSAAFGKYGLTSSQAEALEVIGNYGPLSTGEVGSYLVCEPGSPSRLLNTLASKGLTVISQSLSDKRVMLHALSPQGRKIVEKVRADSAQFEADLADAVAAASSQHSGGVVRVLAELVAEPDLRGALSARFPDLFSTPNE